MGRLFLQASCFLLWVVFLGLRARYEITSAIGAKPAPHLLRYSFLLRDWSRHRMNAWHLKHRLGSNCGGYFVTSPKDALSLLKSLSLFKGREVQVRRAIALSFFSISENFSSGIAKMSVR